MGLEWIFDWICGDVRRAQARGALMMRVGLAWLFAGLLGQLVVHGRGLVLGLAGKAAERLADVVPNLPTWWVPESALGSLPALLMLGLGGLIWRTARDMARIYQLDRRRDW